MGSITPPQNNPQNHLKTPQHPPLNGWGDKIQAHLIVLVFLTLRKQPIHVPQVRHGLCCALPVENEEFSDDFFATLLFVGWGLSRYCWYYVNMPPKSMKMLTCKTSILESLLRRFGSQDGIKDMETHLPESPRNSCSLDSLCCSRFWCNDPAISTRNATMPLGPTQTCLSCPWISRKLWKTLQQRAIPAAHPCHFINPILKNPDPPKAEAKIISPWARNVIFPA